MRQNKLRLFVHFVWATWDRLPMIEPEFERRLYRAIEEAFRRAGCVVLAIGGTVDHVHVLTQVSATASVSDLMEGVKGSSSHFVNHEIRTRNFFKWQGHYGAFTVSNNDRARVIEYILRQKERHGSGELWDSTEHSWEDVPRQEVDDSAGCPPAVRLNDSAG